MAQPKKVKLAKDLHKETLMQKDFVVGVGTGFKISRGEETGELCIVTMVRQKVPKSALSAAAMVPPEIDGVRTDIIEVGDLWAFQTPRSRFRPAPGGVSISHYQSPAGTFGCVVRDQQYGTRLILSNNHVLAKNNEAKLGDPILQPSPTDGGQDNLDIFAYLVRMHPLLFAGQDRQVNKAAKGFINFGNFLSRLFGSQINFSAAKKIPEQSNYIDAALARPADDSDILDEIQGIGKVSQTTPARLGMPVRKYGRTTGLTTGTVRVLDATITINYFNGCQARFEKQIITTPMSQGGDSGSLLVDGSAPLAVGLLFAGSAQATTHNPIQLVLDTLRVSL
ncbi:MAG: hypothetical protein RBT34_06745 [Anaerolineaceae bacterium]|jgi:hypothetical protein|nr:hypothetical protein [Anaerolineaceae bacterium]